MYILARADISPGLQAAQSTHAAFLLSMQSPDVVDAWLQASSTIVLLNVPDEPSLLLWASECQREGVCHLLVREPDLDNEATALIVAPSVLGSRFAALPLQGKVLVS